MAQAKEVLPTPPFPVKKKNRTGCSKMRLMESVTRRPAFPPTFGGIESKQFSGLSY